MWDLAAGKAMGVLTHHKKGVRALATHPTEFTFATGSTGSIKQWKCPEGAFMQNFEGHNAIINTLSVNDQNVFFSGGDNGSMSFWDWKSGYRFQSLDTTAQPGSLDAESGLMSSIFDNSGSRLICGEADKTSKLDLICLSCCVDGMLTMSSQNLEGGPECHTGIPSPRLEADIVKEEVLDGKKRGFVCVFRALCDISAERDEQHCFQVDTGLYASRSCCLWVSLFTKLRRVP